MHFDEIQFSPSTRRGFLKRMTAAGLGVAASSLLAGTLFTPSVANAETPRDFTLDEVRTRFPGIPGNSKAEIVLNFALTLEILEADLYRQALNIASRRALSDPLEVDGSKYKLAVKSGRNLSDKETAVGFLYLVQFAYVEAAHRDFLIAAITASGGTPTTAAPNGYKFPKTPSPGISYILGDILGLEETGVRAYLGALPFLADQLGLAQVAGGIYSTEARHSAAVRYVLDKFPGPTPYPGDQKVIATYPSKNTLEYFLEPATVLSAASVYFA